MPIEQRLEKFQNAISPHLGAAYNYARWLTRGHQDAEDLVQEACMRALQYFDAFRAENSRAWLFTIVRNTFYNWAKASAAREILVEDEELDEKLTSPDAHTLLLQELDAARLKEAIENLPVDAREVIVLRELEGLSYKEISDVTQVPIGTVMSRLARARGRLQKSLSTDEEGGTR